MSGPAGHGVRSFGGPHDPDLRITPACEMSPFRSGPSKPVLLMLVSCTQKLQGAWGDGASRPRARACATASVRPCAPSLPHTWRTCVRTVFTDTDSSRAISGADKLVGRYRSTRISPWLNGSATRGDGTVSRGDGTASRRDDPRPLRAPGDAIPPDLRCPSGSSLMISATR